MGTKLYEVLAVESTKEKVANKLLKESLHTMNKETLFKGGTRKLEMFRDEDKNSETVEHQELTTTVDENLDYLVNPLSDWLNVVLTKDIGNQIAKADLVVEGKVLLSDVPATFLLGLESKLNKFREVYEAIPTLAPGTKWIEDTQDRPGVFIAANDAVQMKTRKDPEFRVVYEATDKHPADVRQVERVLDIGRFVATLRSGMMTPLEKANRLKRLDQLLAAVKVARMQANSVEVVTTQECRNILTFINKG